MDFPCIPSGDAVNVLAFGAKRWALLPPGSARYSTMPAQQWFSTRLPELIDRKVAIQCVQHPGEAMFVPEGWGHAILNLQPSVGFASEFEQRGQALHYQPGDYVPGEAMEVHEVPWCNNRRWMEHLYTCREL